MAGTPEGGRKAALKNLQRDPTFYSRIGSTGGKNGTGHAFAHGKVDPSVAGAKGGHISKRTKVAA